jgi:hypothetical protein
LAGGWRTLNPLNREGVPHPFGGLVYQRVRGLTLLFSCSSRMRRSHSALLIAVQPSFSTPFAVKHLTSSLRCAMLSRSLPLCCLAAFLILSPALALCGIISILELTPLASLKSFPLSFQALTGVHFATPLLSHSCRSGGYPLPSSTFGRADVPTFGRSSYS